MNWGLKQGLLGGRQQTLSPSMAALGHNTYLQPQDFLKMVGVALLLHALVIGIASIWPDRKVTDIPVRALTFKIGAGERILFAPSIPPDEVAPVTPQPQPAPAPRQTWRADPRPQPVKPAKITPAPAPLPRQVPLENPAPAPVIQKPALPDTNILTTQAAIAPSPQRFIREAPALAAGSPAETAQAARERYEQEISGWIQQHKFYPTTAGGREGRTVVRVRIDRTGYVRYYAIEESSGSTTLDAAAIDMIRRANPMPAVPSSYPAGNLIEFLIPIVFRVPQ